MDNVVVVGQAPEKVDAVLRGKVGSEVTLCGVSARAYVRVVCVCVCVCVLVYRCIFICMRMFRAYVCVCVRVYAHTRAHTSILTHECMTCASSVILSLFLSFARALTPKRTNTR